MSAQAKFPGTWNSWNDMRKRCNNPNHKDYKRYGKRGITVCERWNHFSNFLADMGPRPEKLTLERMNNDGNYEPVNCKWATRAEQNRNKRQPQWGKDIEFNGRRMSITAWAQELGMKPNTLTRRFLAGWHVERALAFPIIDGRVGNQNARKK